VENASFIWLLTEEILVEYKEVLRRLGVRRSLIGAVINQLREEAEFVDVRFASEVSPDPGDNPFCACAEQGGRLSSQPSIPRIFLRRGFRQR
jgi:hypothetical protein